MPLPLRLQSFPAGPRRSTSRPSTSTFRLSPFFQPFLLSLILLLAPQAARADATLAKIFADGMVLQQQKPVPVWGGASPGEEVTVSLAGQTATTKADASGNWKVTLQPLKVVEAAAPLEMTVTAKNKLSVRDILVGEVWLCSGQSNMETMLREAGRFMTPEVALPPNPNLRMFVVTRNSADSPQQEIKGGSWQSASPQTLPNFCSTAYFFGKELQKQLHVPIGLVASTIGGMPCEAWVSLPKLSSDPETKAIADAQILATQQGIEKNKTLAPNDRARWPDWKIMATASYLYNAMIHPLTPFAIRGVIWYQGEANEIKPQAYAKLFPELITDWREHWGDPELPFYFCQLPGNRLAHPYIGCRPYLREGQTSGLSQPKTGMAVLIDTGEEESNHPRDKAPVGDRLARLALNKTYGKPIECEGPAYAGVEFAGGKATVRFGKTPGGLVAGTLPTEYQPDTLKPAVKQLVRNSPGSQVEGFALAGSDRKWVWADAKIEGDTVIVSSPAVPNPVAVRYAWVDFPICNLKNTAGLPVAPFRSDDWPLEPK